MDFSLTEDQRALQDAVERYLEREYDFQSRERRRHSGAPCDAGTWRHLAELGLLAMPIREEYEGLGGGPVETMVAARAFGRALLLEPWFASVVLAGGALQAAGGAAAAKWLPQVAAGASRLALAHEEHDSCCRLNSIATKAVAEGGGYRLKGTKLLVQHGNTADALLVTARTSGEQDDAAGISLFVVDPATPGVRLRAYRTQDSLAAADVEMKDVLVPADALVGEEGKALPVVQEAVDRGIAALAAEALGLMELLLETTVEYLKTRRQFGKPLAAFQALQHDAVDMLIATEQVRSMTYFASGACDWTDAAARTRAMSSVKVLVGRCARQVSQLAVQLHGAIGLTDECLVSHAFRRLMAIEMQFGDTHHHLALYAANGPARYAGEST
jgi:alkylation response protein AidB-like acyl-CoA dehydrogenase